MQNRKMIVPVLALGILMGGAGVLATKNASAFFGGKNSDQMASDLASKLNVSKDSVTNAMNQIHDERRAEMQKAQDAKLDQAVKDGVITEEQKTKLIEKRNEMRTKMEAQQKANREEMDKWFSDNGIDQTKIQGYMGGGKGGRMHGYRKGFTPKN